MPGTVSEQVVVLGRLQRHAAARQGPELPRPHAGRVDDDLGLDPAALRQYRGDPAVRGLDSGGGHAFDDRDTQLARTLGQRGRHAHRIGPALVGHIEAGQDVVGARERPHLGHLAGRDLGVLHPEAVHPLRLTPQRLLPLRRGGDRDVPDGPEPGRVPGFLLEPRVQVAGVAAEEQRGLVGHPGRRDQASRVPGSTGRQRVLLE